VLTVRTMARIVETTEAGEFFCPELQHDPKTMGGAITAAAAHTARMVGAKALVAFSQTGDTVRRLARIHNDLPLLAFTPEDLVRRQLALSWGVESFVVPYVHHTDDMFRQVDHALLELGRGEIGDLVVIVAGTPASTPGTTNTLRVHRLGSLSETA
jgi:pyruvate kinase